MRRSTLAAVLFGVTVAPSLAAQTGSELAMHAIGTYRVLEYDSAAALLRRALDATGRAALPDTSRAPLYVYLGATEFFRGRTLAADTAFMRALMADPRQRPDPLIFPPEVTAAFEIIRRRSLFVDVLAARDTVIVPRQHQYRLRLYASTQHQVTVELVWPDGRPAGRLYAGAITDSLDVYWNGIILPEDVPPSGRLLLNIASRSPAGRQRVLRMPIDAGPAPLDTITPPPSPLDSAPIATRAPALRGAGPLAVGILTGLGTVILPALIADDHAGGPTRYVVGGTLSLAGVLAFIAQRQSESDEKAATDQATLKAWRQDIDRVHNENEQRRRNAGLRIRAGPATPVESEAP